MEFKISRKYAYIVMFVFLDSYADCKNPLHGHLCDLLSSWEPMMEHRISRDPGVYSEWKDVIREKMENKEYFSQEDIFEATIHFLEYHLTFTYELEWLIEKIKNDYSDKNKLSFFMNKTLDMIINIPKGENIISMKI